MDLQILTKDSVTVFVNAILYYKVPFYSVFVFFLLICLDSVQFLQELFYISLQIFLNLPHIFIWLPLASV